MSFALLRQILRHQRIHLLVVVVGVFGWGVLSPVTYQSFSDALKKLKGVPSAVTHFGSGDIYSLGGWTTIFFEHPLFLAMVATVVVGMTASAIAGARAGGTLELLLAHPLSRHRLLITHGAAVSAMLGVVLLSMIGGMVLGAALSGSSGALPFSALPLIWVNAFLLFLAFAAFGLLASIVADRPGPALAMTIGYLLAHYFVLVIAGFWDILRPYQTWSFFYHFQTSPIISGSIDLGDLGLLFAAAAVPFTVAMLLYPRMDIAAPI